MSIQCGLSPTILSRLIINEKYPNLPKNKILEMIKNPYTIPDDCLAANARACSFCDNQDGPIVDVIRRCVGEEYEQKVWKQNSVIVKCFLTSIFYAKAQKYGFGSRHGFL